MVDEQKCDKHQECGCDAGVKHEQADHEIGHKCNEQKCKHYYIGSNKKGDTTPYIALEHMVCIRKELRQEVERVHRKDCHDCSIQFICYRLENLRKVFG